MGNSVPSVGVDVIKPLDTIDRHFATAHLLSDIKKRTVSSGIVTALSQAVQFVLNFVAVVVLARLLSPADFGLVAMVTTVTGFLRIFNDAGLSTATIQRDGITHAQVSNLFWTNVTLGLAITLLLALGSPLIAWFFHEPRLGPVTLALCTTFFLTSSAVQHLALLKRQMRFRLIAGIEIGSAAAGAAVGIGMACANCGYWSLVGMQLTVPSVAFLLTWMTSSWRPQRPTRGCGTRPLINFGANLTASSFLWSLARGTDALLIGRFYGSASLGLYTRAAALLARPVQQAIGPLEAVFVPMLSRLQHQPERYRNALLQAYGAIAVGTFLFTGLFLALAEPLTAVVLGRKWDAAAPVLAAFALVALHMPLGSVASWLLTSQGRGRDFLIQSTIGSVITIISFGIGLPFGPVGVAFSYSAFCMLVALPLSYYIAGRRGPVSAKDLWFRFFLHLPVWIVVTGTTWLVRSCLTHSTPAIQLLVCVPVGLLAGGAFVGLYSPSRKVVISVFAALKHWRQSRRKSPAE